MSPGWLPVQSHPQSSSGPRGFRQPWLTGPAEPWGLLGVIQLHMEHWFILVPPPENGRCAWGLLGWRQGYGHPGISPASLPDCFLEHLYASEDSHQMPPWPRFASSPAHIAHEEGQEYQSPNRSRSGLDWRRGVGWPSILAQSSRCDVRSWVAQCVCREKSEANEPVSGLPFAYMAVQAFLLHNFRGHPPPPPSKLCSVPRLSHQLQPNLLPCPWVSILWWANKEVGASLVAQR